MIFVFSCSVYIYPILQLQGRGKNKKEHWKILMISASILHALQDNLVRDLLFEFLLYCLLLQCFSFVCYLNLTIYSFLTLMI